MKGRGGKPSDSSGGASGWVLAASGSLLLRSFSNAPYPHESRSGGWKSMGRTFTAAKHYSDSTVGLFIPDAFRPEDSVDFVVHFHGHMNHVSQVLEQFDLPAQFAASGVNAVLVVPQGPKDSPDSGCGRLELEPGAFRAMMEEVAGVLYTEGRSESAKIGRIVLSAHSGGYRVTSRVLESGGLTDQITDVLLFDAAYDLLDGFADWCAGGEGRRLVSIFTAHLAGENTLLMSMLQKRGVEFGVYDESALSPSDVLPRRPHFVFTTELEHNDVVHTRRYFEQWLASSALGKPGP